jgi:hypothetical protein
MSYRYIGTRGDASLRAAPVTFELQRANSLVTTLSRKNHAHVVQLLLLKSHIFLCSSQFCSLHNLISSLPSFFSSLLAVLVGLYEEPERPANAVDYIKVRGVICDVT